MNTDEKIRAILQMEADAVEPSAAGFDAIREGIAKKRARTWWVRGSAFAGVGLTTAAALVVLASNPTPQTIRQPPAASNSATARTEPTPAPSGSFAPAPAPGTPLGTIWPLTTQRELNEWHADNSTYPSLASAATSATAFTNKYLLTPQANAVQTGEKDGDLFFDVTYMGQVITKLEVRGFGANGTAPFLVTRASSEAVKISSPLPGAKATSPLRVEGDVHEVEPRVLVRLRADGPGSAPVELGDVFATHNAPNVWSAELAFTTTHTTGSIFVGIKSPRGDDVLSAAAVIPVTFTPAVGTPSGDGFVAIRDQRVALFEPGGKLVRFLTEQEPGGGAYAPDVSPDGTKVAWSQGGGTCVLTAKYAPLNGGEPVVIGGGSGLYGRTTWVGNGRIAFTHTECGGSGDETTLQLYDLASKKVTTLAPLDDVPVALGASPDGKHLAYVVRDTLTTYEIGSGATQVIRLRSGCQWRAVDVIGSSTVGEPILLTGRTCADEPGFLVDRFATNAPDTDRVTERKHDAMAYRLSYDEASKAVLISHGLEDGETYVEISDVNGLRLVRDADQASW